MIIENLMIREEDEDSHRIDNKCDESVNAIGHNAWHIWLIYGRIYQRYYHGIICRRIVITVTI